MLCRKAMPLRREGVGRDQYVVYEGHALRGGSVCVGGSVCRSGTPTLLPPSTIHNPILSSVQVPGSMCSKNIRQETLTIKCRTVCSPALQAPQHTILSTPPPHHTVLSLLPYSPRSSLARPHHPVLPASPAAHIFVCGANSPGRRR